MSKISAVDFRHGLVAASVVAAFLVANRSDGFERGWRHDDSGLASPEIGRGVDRDQSCHPDISSTLSRWDTPLVARSANAGRTYRTAARQPAGAMLTLVGTLTTRKPTDREDDPIEPVSAIGPNGPICSVNTPMGPVCTINPICPTPPEFPVASEPVPTTIGYRGTSR